MAHMKRRSGWRTPIPGQPNRGGENAVTGCWGERDREFHAMAAVDVDEARSRGGGGVAEAHVV